MKVDYPLSGSRERKLPFVHVAGQGPLEHANGGKRPVRYQAAINDKETFVRRQGAGLICIT